jgi:hypothetical protein
MQGNNNEGQWWPRNVQERRGNEGRKEGVIEEREERMWLFRRDAPFEQYTFISVQCQVFVCAAYRLQAISIDI